MKKHNLYKGYKSYTVLAISLILSLDSVYAQVHEMSKKYQLPEDSAVQKKLLQWQDLKFGLFMHWGTYSQWGVVESWSICPEDEGWTQRKGPYGDTYNGYKQAYENLQTTFNPLKFDPEKWVKAAKYAGMKYVVFTTKHHDGFCMFDTKQTDYKITSTKTPFSASLKSNVTKEIFKAFGQENFMIGAYFSKPDWHSPYYWWPYFPPKDRNVNYDPAKHPERWRQFTDYTYNQISELMTGYGKVDILWLDGGWVRPKNTIDTTVDWQRTIKYDQDINMPKIAGMARSYQPGLIIVDRTVTGQYENYTTPEQQVPDAPLDHPWETCMTMGNSWSYVPGDHYKSADQIIQLLVKIVSRGGNLLMNIGPSPEGDWDPEAYDRLKAIGDWMSINSEGIYASKPFAPYSDGNIYYTKAKDKNIVYAFILADDHHTKLPGEIAIILPGVKKVKTVKLLGNTSKLKWRSDSKGITVSIPSSVMNENIKNASCLKVIY